MTYIARMQESQPAGGMQAMLDAKATVPVQPKGVILFCHGFKQGHPAAYQSTLQVLANAGFVVLSPLTPSVGNIPAVEVKYSDH